MRPLCVKYTPHRNIGSLRAAWEQIVGLVQFRHVVYNLVVDRITRRYHGSALGVFWSLLNPILHLLALAIIFPLFMRVRMEDYVIYLFSGLLAWGFIAGVINGGNDAILSGDRLLRKVYLPAIIFPVVVTLTEAVNMLITAVALHAIGFALGYRMQTNVLYLTVAVVVTVFFVAGVIAVLNVLVVYFRDLKHMLRNVMQALFFLSAIFFPVSAIPEKYRFLMELNPFYHFIRLFHVAIYRAEPGEWGYLVVPGILAVVSVVAALWVYGRYGRSLIYRL